MEKENQNYRETLAKEIYSEKDKKTRQVIVDTAKEDPEYWKAREEKRSQTENEEISEDGLSVIVKNKSLYHGSAVSGIKSFNNAEDETIGSGLYCTSKADKAIGYARGRSRARNKDNGGSPIIYEVKITDLRLANLRSNENVQNLLSGYEKVLRKELLENKKLQWFMTMNIEKALELFKEGKVNIRNLSRLTGGGLGGYFTRYLQSNGYDGLVTYEGGESDFVGEHDSYIIFDPKKAKVTAEHKIV